MAVYMYRKGEARIFASPDDVPQGEGWVDSPAKVVDSEPPKTDEQPKKRRKKAEPDGNSA